MNNFNEIESILQKFIAEEKPIWVTDKKYGKRKVLPTRIENDLISGKHLICWVILVEKLGDSGNRTDRIPISSITTIQE